jgi:hypothetical protein
MNLSPFSHFPHSRPGSGTVLALFWHMISLLNFDSKVALLSHSMTFPQNTQNLKITYLLNCALILALFWHCARTTILIPVPRRMRRPRNPIFMNFIIVALFLALFWHCSGTEILSTNLDFHNISILFPKLSPFPSFPQIHEFYQSGPGSGTVLALFWH